MKDEKSTNPWYVIAGAIILAVFFFFILVANNKTSPLSDKAALDSLALDTIKPKSASGSSTPKDDAPKEVSNWSYSSDVDEMTDKKSYYAECTSLNIVNFDFPYEGGSTLSIIIRKSPKFGRDVFIKIRPGQFIAGVDGCTIRVRVDGKRIKSFSCSESDSGSSDVLFINSTSTFISLLKRSHSIKIEAPFYQYGYQVFNFEVKGLKWNH